VDEYLFLSVRNKNLFMKKVLWGLFLIMPVLVFGQLERNNQSGVLNIGFEYCYHIPGGDLKDRFGNTTGLGLKTEYLLKSNWSFSLEAAYLFGRTVKEDPIAGLRDQDNVFIGNNGVQAQGLSLRERVVYFGGSVGKLIPILKKNKRSGIKIELGAGLLQHKIRIQDDPESFVPIVGGDYKKGFDRLSNGLALRQFIGYQHHSNNRLINCYAGFEFTEGFTQNRRSYNFDTMSADDTKRFDMMTGFKVGWILPFFIGEQGEEVFY
jgi:hypothetical protein